MLILKNISYAHTNKERLFENISLVVNNHEKTALVGNNGSGKSTLLRIIAGELSPANGQINRETKPYFIPQIFGQYNHLTVAQALQTEAKLNALQEILAGNATTENLILLDDDWTIEERCREALRSWLPDDLDLSQRMETLSGGQKTKVFLAGISIHQPEFILMDEPSNHLDTSGRKLLYDFVRQTSCTLLVVSHDKTLLNLLEKVCELNRRGITVYGGNYDFYAAQKQVEKNALHHDLADKEKALRKAKETERETIERKQKQSVRGKKKHKNTGTGKAMMDKMKNDAEKSAAKIQHIHAEKMDGIAHELQELRAFLPDMDKMKFGFENSNLHQGKILFSAAEINHSWRNQFLWKTNLNFEITSGERIALKGANGSGKTTLIKIILGDLEPQTGKVYRANNQSVYIDQDYSLINQGLSVYEQAQHFNLFALQEHEIKTRLNRFLFPKEFWDKPCSALSGGERMRLTLCCLNIRNQSPDIIVLDEPTNNLDMQNVEILTKAMREYQGTLIVVSHDETFLEQVNAGREVRMEARMDYFSQR